MPERRLTLQFPLRGLSDDTALSEQQPLTTSDARNVRGIDPVSGRSRGSQRAGMEKFNSAALGASMVQDIAVVTRDSPKVDYANLATGNLTVEWSSVTPQEGTTWWPEPDFQGNIVLLDGDNQLAKYNADGVLLRSIAVLAPGGGSVVRKVQVDVDGGVYVCAHAPDYSSGYIRRLIDSEVDDSSFEEAWTYEFTNEGPTMFCQRGNTLYVVTKPSTGFVEYKLNRLDGGVSTVPTLGTSEECPGPVNALEMSVKGTLWLSAGANAARGSGPDSQGLTHIVTSSKMWTPHDAPNADQRLYFDTSADNIDGQFNATLTDGDEVEVWADNRFSDPNVTAVKDTTDRSWEKDDNGTAGNRRHGPTYRATGWGGLPCLEFDGTDARDGGSSLAGQALVTAGHNANNTKKADADATLAGQAGVIPGQDDAEYVTVIVLQIDETLENQGPSAILSQYAEGAGGPGTGGAPFEAISYGLVGNAAWSSGSVVWSESDALLKLKGNGSTATMSGGTGDGTSGAQASEGEFDPDNGYAIITLIHYGISITESSALRINGTNVDSFTLLKDQNYGTNCGLTILGCRRKTNTQNTDIEFFTDSDGYVSLSGKVRRIVTMLSDSSAGSGASDTHDLNIPHARATDLALLGPFMVGQYPGRVDPEGASLVELLEGTLAHGNGMSHLLPHGDIDAEQVSGYPDNHPFGGTGNWPVAPGETTTRKEHDLWSPLPVLAMYDPNSLEVIDAIAGSGVGYALATDEDGDCIAVGAKNGLAGFGTHYGPDGTDDSDIIARKVADRSTGMSFATASRGSIRLVGYRDATTGAGAAMPSDGDQVVIDDGQNPAVTFEFDSDGSVSETATLRQVDISGTTPSTITTRLETAINAAPTLNIVAQQNGPFVCEVWNTAQGAYNGTITVPVGDTRIEVRGLSGGVAQSETWTLSNGGDAPDTAGLRMAFDDEGDLWVPQLLAGDDETVTKLDGTDGSTLVEYDLAATQEATGVALPLSHPSYIGSPSVTGPLFMWVTSTGGALDPQQDNFRSVRLVSETQDLSGALTPRATRFLGVVGGVVKEFDNGSTVTTKSGGTLVSDSPYISSVVIYNKVVWTDGETYLTYDAQTDVLEPLISRKGGTLPKNGRVLANWNGRLLIARTADEPYNIYGSRRGDITDWDEFPAVPDYLEAFSTPNSIAGRCPDIVNALMPLDDDLLVVGGDHSIFRLTGDPTAGGAFDLVSDITGASFGQGWCKDPGGALYFFGSRGGVYRMAGGSVERLTRDRIERRMADLDLSSYRLRLVYCHEAEEIQVIPVPYAAKLMGATPPVRWALDKNGAWWEDDSASWDVAPTAVAVADGDDPDDRVLLYGCEDGNVRKWSQSAKSDTGERIASHVRIGPIAPTQSGREFRFMSPQIVLASDQGGATVEFYATDDPQTLGEPVGSAVLGPGMNPRLPVRARGAYLYAVIRNAELSGRWAYEQGTVSVAPAGRQRVR